MKPLLGSAGSSAALHAHCMHCLQVSVTYCKESIYGISNTSTGELFTNKNSQHSARIQRCKSIVTRANGSFAHAQKVDNR